MNFKITLIPNGLLSHPMAPFPDLQISLFFLMYLISQGLRNYPENKSRSGVTKPRLPEVLKCALKSHGINYFISSLINSKHILYTFLF